MRRSHRLRGAVLAAALLAAGPALPAAAQDGTPPDDQTTESTESTESDEPTGPATDAGAGNSTAVSEEAATRYAVAVFELFLERAPTEDELARWVPTIQWGGRRALSLALARTEEWTGARIDALYERIFGRGVDASGRDHWVEQVAGGRTLEDIAAFLYGSVEYYRDASGGTDDGFVDGLYRDLLGRGSDASGRAYWVDRLGDGLSRDTVAAGFFDSRESRRERVRTLFSVVLRRSPEEGALEHWMDAVRQLGDVALAAYLAASDEFYERATGEDAPPIPERGTGTGFEPYAVAVDVTLAHPAVAVDLIGYHESDQDGGRRQDPAPGAAPSRLLPTRWRGTDRRSAADIVVPPEAEIRAPVTGTVVAAGAYVLYCEYRDDFVRIEPDDHPGWVVRMLHIDGVLVEAGDRVVAGITPLAPRATVLPFESQVEEYTASPPWPHVHVDVIDPSIPDRPGSGC